MQVSITSQPNGLLPERRDYIIRSDKRIAVGRIIVALKRQPHSSMRFVTYRDNVSGLWCSRGFVKQVGVIGIDR